MMPSAGRPSRDRPERSPMRSPPSRKGPSPISRTRGTSCHDRRYDLPDQAQQPLRLRLHRARRCVLRAVPGHPDPVRDLHQLPPRDRRRPRTRRGRPHRDLGGAGELHRRAGRPRIPGQCRPCTGLRLRARTGDAGPGAAVRAAAGLSPGPRARLRSDRDLPALRGACRDLLGAVGLLVPARNQPFPPHRRGARGRTARCPVTVAGAAGDRQHRHLGRHRLQHGRAVHLAEVSSQRAVRGRHVGRLQRGAGRHPHQGPDDPALADHDRGVLDHRHLAGVRGADAAATADQLDLHHLVAADADLPRCLHPERHLYRLRRFRPGGTGDLCDLLRLPAPGARTGLRPGRAVSPAMTTTTDTLKPRSSSAPVDTGRGRAAPGGRPTGSGVERPSIIATGILLLGALYALLPVVWVLIAASKSPEELFSTFSLAPSTHLVDNLRDLFTYRDGLFFRWAGNTVLYAVGGALASTVVSAAAGYGLAKFAFRGKRLFFNVILAGVLLPAVILAVPQYLLFAQIGLANTYWAVFLPSILNPYGIYLARIYAGAAIPTEMIEARSEEHTSELQSRGHLVCRLLLE